MRGSTLSVEHLLLSLRPINRALRDAVARQAEVAARLDRPDLVPLCVTDQHVNELLDEVENLPWHSESVEVHRSTRGLNIQELAIESDLQRQAYGKHSRLPLIDMTAALELNPFERAAILLCAAPEIDRAYERIFGYIMDDLNRRFPCVELLCTLAASTPIERLEFRQMLSPNERLRRMGLLQSFGDSATGLRTQLRLGSNVLEFLLGDSSHSVSLWIDPHEIKPAVDPMDFPNGERLQQIGNGVASGVINAVGIWAQSGSDLENAATLIARSAGLPLRRFAVNANAPANELRQHVATAIHAAAAQNAMLLVAVDSLLDHENATFAKNVAECLSTCQVPIVLIGAEPWRPTQLLQSRSYTELSLQDPDHATRESQWEKLFPDADPNRLAELASCYRMSREEMQAIARVARSDSELSVPGSPDNINDRLRRACATVARKTRGRFVSDVKPKRTADDLILPPELHRQVLEIASFTRVLPKVTEEWGFGRLATGGTGMKCLFTGDPGTGKTLAAEVVADALGVRLLKLNIAETVSKWVGETEKNVDAAFREATASNALLFMDEADALCGKRGDVQHGVDRFANMEVSHLLQRLEDHSGLVIMASNLKDNIDPAFTRRFHVVINFPRPTETDRRRIWQVAFPKGAPLAQEVDTAVLARLDMTGAGIVAAARTSALLAANEDGHITMTHILRGIARQYHREARILTSAELGPYADLLKGQS